MNVWLVNPFDPLPGDPEQQGRYATLARLLCARGHRVTWWTSSFSHRFKRPVDAAAIAATCETIGIRPVFLQAPPYPTNVSVARLRNHRVLARRFGAEAPRHRPAPDVVIASTPPPTLARQAILFARQAGVPSVLDVQDLWPDTFDRLAPWWLRPAFGLALRPMRRAADEAYRLADAVVGVADAYRDEALRLGGPERPAETIPLGVDLADFDAAARRGACEELTKPPGETWLIYSGSLNRSYDCLTLTEAFADASARLDRPVRLFVTGRGELSDALDAIVRRRGLRNVTRTGFLEFDRWAWLVTQCDAGFNASFPEAMIYLPNKIFYYLAGGLAVLNTIPGQCSRLVAEGRCGLDYRAGDAADCAAAIQRLLGDPAALAEMRRAARALAESTYDRAVLYPRYAAFLERLAGLRPPDAPPGKDSDRP